MTEPLELKNIDPEKQYTTAEVAEILDISTVSVFNRIKVGTIKAEMVGGSYQIKGANLQLSLNVGILEEDKAKIAEAITKMTSQYAPTLAMLDIR